MRILRKNRDSDLSKYTVKCSSPDLFKLFSSLSFQARKALEAVMKYEIKQSGKNAIFVLEPSNQSFFEYANIVANEENKIELWKKQKRKEL